MREGTKDAIPVTSVTPDLRERFVRTARWLYGNGGPGRALEEAIGLWLSRAQRPSLVDAERVLNNRAFLEMRKDLESKYQGKYVVIAHGRLQGVGDTFEEVKDLVPEARHRLIFRVGDILPKERNLGWRIKKI